MIRQITAFIAVIPIYNTYLNMIERRYKEYVRAVRNVGAHQGDVTRHRGEVRLHLNGAHVDRDARKVIRTTVEQRSIIDERRSPDKSKAIRTTVR